MDEQVLTFGSFEVFPDLRLLLNRGRPLQLRSRAFDILKVLLVRKALGDDHEAARFITNIPGRGYCFVAPASARGVTPALAAPAATPRRGAPLPVTRVIGRDDPVGLVAAQLPARRAGLAELLLRRVSGVDILATSREPLRADGEWVQRLPPLGLPPPGSTVSAAAALAWPAVQLFVERAPACLGGWTLGDAGALLVIEICRRLHGIGGLAAALDDCFRVSTRGRRTALPRHRTMRATLDWPYRQNIA